MVMNMFCYVNYLMSVRVCYDCFVKFVMMVFRVCYLLSLLENKNCLKLKWIKRNFECNF